MGQFSDLFSSVWRDFNTDGVPASGNANPKKADIRSIGPALDDALAAAAAGEVVAETWPVLESVVGTREGQPGYVKPTDLGTHTDPVVGGTVPNSGSYRWSESPAGWLRIGAYFAAEIENVDGLPEALDAKAETTALEAEETARTDGDAANAAAIASITGDFVTTQFTRYRNSLGQYVGVGDGSGYVATEVTEDNRAIVISGGSTGPVDVFAPMQRYRNSLGQYVGVGSRSFSAAYISEDNRLLSVAGGGSGISDLSIETDRYRKSLGQFVGYGAFDTAAPTLVTEDGRVISTDEGAIAREPDYLSYIASGVLRAVGGSAGDRVVNDDAGKTWLKSETRPGRIQALYQDAGSDVHLVSVSPTTGDTFYDGEITIVFGYGQSNSEGQAASGAANLHASNPYPSRLQMPASPDNNVWVGHITTGGTSTELDPGDVTGFAQLVSSLGDATHGTTAIESFALKRGEVSAEACGDYVPTLVVWTGAEGGQDAADLKKGAVGVYGYANVMTVVERLQATKPAAQRLVARWIEMAQSEADTDNASLGADHKEIQEDFSTDIAAETGQSEPVRMVSYQMSSFFSSHDGVRSILAQHLALNGSQWAEFICGGPTYCYPFSSDFLHQTSIGHDMRGEHFEAVTRRFERDGYCDPLYALSASITDTDEITVVFSEEIVIDGGNPFVAVIANAGVVVPGKTVNALNVSGSDLIITLTGAAAGATDVEIALAGHSGTRAEATIPRSNIRAAASLGTFRASGPILKWACHQRVAIT